MRQTECQSGAFRPEYLRRRVGGAFAVSSSTGDYHLFRHTPLFANVTQQHLDAQVLDLCFFRPDDAPDHSLVVGASAIPPEGRGAIGDDSASEETCEEVCVSSQVPNGRSTQKADATTSQRRPCSYQSKFLSQGLASSTHSARQYACQRDAEKQTRGRLRNVDQIDIP